MDMGCFWLLNLGLRKPRELVDSTLQRSRVAGCLVISLQLFYILVGGKAHERVNCSSAARGPVRLGPTGLTSIYCVGVCSGHEQGEPDCIHPRYIGSQAFRGLYLPDIFCVGHASSGTGWSFRSRGCEGTDRIEPPEN